MPLLSALRSRILESRKSSAKLSDGLSDVFVDLSPASSPRIIESATNSPNAPGSPDEHVHAHGASGAGSPVADTPPSAWRSRADGFSDSGGRPCCAAGSADAPHANRRTYRAASRFIVTLPPKSTAYSVPAGQPSRRGRHASLPAWKGCRAGPMACIPTSPSLVTAGLDSPMQPPCSFSQDRPFPPTFSTFADLHSLRHEAYHEKPKPKPLLMPPSKLQHLFLATRRSPTLEPVAPGPPYNPHLRKCNTEQSFDHAAPSFARPPPAAFSQIDSSSENL